MKSLWEITIDYIAEQKLNKPWVIRETVLNYMKYKISDFREFVDFEKFGSGIQLIAIGGVDYEDNRALATKKASFENAMCSVCYNVFGSPMWDYFISHHNQDVDGFMTYCMENHKKKYKTISKLINE